MRSIGAALFAAAAFSALGCAHGAGERLKGKAERVITLYRDEGPEGEEKIAGAFARIEIEDAESARLKSYDTRTLELLFQAVYLGESIRDRPELAGVLERVYREELARGFIGDMPRMYERFVASRQWAKARELAASFPSKERELPEIVEPASVPLDGPAVYDVSPDGKRLTLEAVDLVSHPLVVAVVNPGCHFSVDADAAIAADPMLSEALERNALNVYAAAFTLDADEIAETNRSGKRRVKILYKPSGWKGLDFRNTPHFYFLRDGKVVDEILGINPAAFIGELKRGIAKLGLESAARPAGDRE